MLMIRTIRQSDYSNVSNLIRTTFANTVNGYRNEAELVDKIRDDPTYQKRLEVVAENGVHLIGHGLLSEIEVVDGAHTVTGLVLAPLAVAPDSQRSGVGSLIMGELDNRAINLGYKFTIVTGWPDYYPRFGYRNASGYGIKSPTPVPDDVFMAKPLVDGGVDGVHGMVHYLQAFNM